MPRPTRPAPGPYFSTGEVMRQTGLSRQVLYQYTLMGLITPVETSPKGHRRYGARVFRDLELIRELNETGYTLRDIREIFFARA